MLSLGLKLGVGSSKIIFYILEDSDGFILEDSDVKLLLALK